MAGADHARILPPDMFGFRDEGVAVGVAPADINGGCMAHLTFVIKAFLYFAARDRWKSSHR